MDRYVEPHFHYDDAFEAIAEAPIMLEGYFQSERYFHAVADRLRGEFTLVEPLGATAKAYSRQIVGAGDFGVSLHVRRGDYVTSATVSAVHTALGLNYYERALSLLRRLLGGEPRVFLFSDEPDFVEEVFAQICDKIVVRSDPLRPWEDMFLMSMCRHHVIANSSFSWWGAWLDPRIDKTVIAPAAWFSREKLSTTNVLDVYPESWILLK
jgi:hypothetical protein